MSQLLPLSNLNGARSGGEIGAPRVLFATGSSGGHVTPALAVAEALRESGQPIQMLFCGPAGGVAERMMASAGEEFVPLEIHPLRGGGIARWSRGLADLPFGVARSLRCLRAVRPALVVSSGAHTSGPLVALAALHGIPTLLFEANVEVGLANRWLGPLVQGAAVAWPETLGSFPGRGFLTGWPVGRAIREAVRQDTPQGERFHLLILGGSLGAPQLDRAMREALDHLGPIAGQLSVVHQASPGEVAILRESYRHAAVEARVEPFFPEMAEHYRRASLAITRPGAATLSELAAVGLPAILVPLGAAGEHQRANARAWEAAGCARSILPQELSGPALAAAVLALAGDRAALERMGRAARAQERRDAARQIAEWCLQALQRR